MNKTLFSIVILFAFYINAYSQTELKYLFEKYENAIKVSNLQRPKSDPYSCIYDVYNLKTTIISNILSIEYGFGGRLPNDVINWEKV